MRQAEGLQCLMDLSDNDLLDLLLRRSELPPELDRPEVSEVLSHVAPARAGAFYHEGRTP